jgi:Zn-dependent protease with chaperone function
VGVSSGHPGGPLRVAPDAAAPSDNGSPNSEVSSPLLLDLKWAAVVLAGGAPLATTDRLILSAQLAEDLAMEVSFARFLAAAPQLSACGAPAGRAARTLAIRLLRLGLRCGHLPTAAAAAERLGVAPAELARLIAALLAQIGQTPLPDRAAQLREYLGPPPLLNSEFSGWEKLSRKRVAPISPARYRHPLDQQATRALQGTLAFEEVARRISEAIPERHFRLENAASRLRVGPDQLPELYALYQACVRRMGIHPEPPLYLGNGGMNARTAGVEQPFLVLDDLLVATLSPRELEFVIGHELGHIQFDHLLYLMVAALLKVPGSVLGQIPVVGPLLTRGLDLALFEWMRKAELSCDRAGLLCCQDPVAANRLMMRFAGVPTSLLDRANPEAFLRQHDALEGQLQDLFSRLSHLVSTAQRSHPHVVVRAHELNAWVERGEYAALLSECGPEVVGGEGVPPMRRCRRCGASMSEHRAFCESCGFSMGERE